MLRCQPQRYTYNSRKSLGFLRREPDPMHLLKPALQLVQPPLHLKILTVVKKSFLWLNKLYGIIIRFAKGFEKNQNKNKKQKHKHKQNKKAFINSVNWSKFWISNILSKSWKNTIIFLKDLGKIFRNEFCLDLLVKKE